MSSYYRFLRNRLIFDKCIDDLERTITELSKSFKNMVTLNPCYLTVTAYLNVVTDAVGSELSLAGK